MISSIRSIWSELVVHSQRLLVQSFCFTEFVFFRIKSTKSIQVFSEITILCCEHFFINCHCHFQKRLGLLKPSAFPIILPQVAQNNGQASIICCENLLADCPCLCKKWLRQLVLRQS